MLSAILQKHIFGQKHLRHNNTVFGKKFIVHIHQLTLSHRSACLLARRILRSFGHAKLSHAKCDRSAGHQHNLMTGILKICKGLDQILHTADI